MVSIYELIGRVVVFVVRMKFGRQLRMAAAASALIAAVLAYLIARHEVAEG